MGDKAQQDCKAKQEIDGSRNPGENVLLDKPNQYKDEKIAEVCCGSHEMQISEGGEADLHKHFNSCQKNPGHKDFIPVNEFTINHLPDEYRESEVVELVKATAYLTVRIDVRMVSMERPAFFTNSRTPYSFYDKRGQDILRTGTGMVLNVYEYTDKMIQSYNSGICTCKRCTRSGKPRTIVGDILVYTATHVVFDNSEAEHTRCRFFFDEQNSSEVTLDDWTVSTQDVDEDICWIKCLVCDPELFEKLNTMYEKWRSLWREVTNKFSSSRKKQKMNFIVSHPHGCPKQVSVGYWLSKEAVRVVNHIWRESKNTYTTCTCPGSSGAYVHTLEFDSLSYHVHSGVNANGTNYSSTGVERIQFEDEIKSSLEI